MSQMILLVDDEPELLKASTLILKSRGFDGVISCDDSRRVMGILASNEISVVILDLYMPHLPGIDLLSMIIHEYPELPVIVMTAVDDAETAVLCIRKGAFDYLVKPVDGGRLVSTVMRALEHYSLSREIDSLRNVLFGGGIRNPEAFAGIVTGSPRMETLFRYMEMISGSCHPVLITGETGTGKELAARAIHLLSGRKGEFVPLNVAGVDDLVFSDTLFGHRKGAFTGADQPRDGLISRAEDGTLFLDEIGDLSEQSQIKLLRLIQEREYYPVGSDISKRTNARIVMATNHDLHALIRERKFRKDLYYRISSHRIEIPPLRERIEDIPLLLDHFLAMSANQLGKKKPTYPRELITLLSTYEFPGNVRELQSLVQDAVARHTGGILSLQSFSETLGVAMSNRQPAAVEGGKVEGIFGHFPTIAEMEDFLVKEALARTSGNQGLAATLLGISRQTLNKKVNRQG
ncbi:MAG: sigma-54 dependent transcriptional regulator [Desulfuromonadia bacterium]